MDKYQLTVIDGTLLKQGQDLENRVAHPPPHPPKDSLDYPPPPLVCDSPDCLQDETNYLNNVFSKNNYNKDFVRRNTHSNIDSNTHTSVNSGPVTKASIPYIRGTSETIARILQSYNIRVAHRPITTLRRLVLTNVKDKDKPEDRQGAVYKIIMLWLPGFLHWWNRQKPKHTTDRTQTRDEEWWRQQSHCWAPFKDETSNWLGLCDMYNVFYRLLSTSYFRKLVY